MVTTRAVMEARLGDVERRLAEMQEENVRAMENLTANLTRQIEQLRGDRSSSESRSRDNHRRRRNHHRRRREDDSRSRRGEESRKGRRGCEGGDRSLHEYDVDGDDVEEDRDESVDLQPPPEPPDWEATETAAAEEWAELMSMAAAVSNCPQLLRKGEE